MYKRTSEFRSKFSQEEFVRIQLIMVSTTMAIKRSHWFIENSCHYILDWIYNEDRCRIRSGYEPENITRLRRFAIGVIKSKGVRNVAQKMRELTRNVRLVFDYLRMTKNSCASASKI